MYDSNEKISSRPEFLIDAWASYKKVISRPVEAELLFDVLLTGNEKQVGAEVKLVDDLYGSLPPRGRLGRQCMDIAVNCDYGYLAIFGSQDEVRASAPTIYRDANNDIIERTEDQMIKEEELFLAIIGDIKELGVIPLFLSRDPYYAYKTLLKYMVHDITDEPPITMMTKPYRNMHAINLLANMPGIGWERADELIKQCGSVFNFMAIAQGCINSGDYTPIENIKINNRKLGKNAHKIFIADGLWD